MQVRGAHFMIIDIVLGSFAFLFPGLRQLHCILCLFWNKTTIPPSYQGIYKAKLRIGFQNDKQIYKEMHRSMVDTLWAVESPRACK